MFEFLCHIPHYKASYSRDSVCVCVAVTQTQLQNSEFSTIYLSTTAQLGHSRLHTWKLRHNAQLKRMP